MCTHVKRMEVPTLAQMHVYLGRNKYISEVQGVSHVFPYNIVLYIYHYATLHSGPTPSTKLAMDERNASPRKTPNSHKNNI